MYRTVFTHCCLSMVLHLSASFWILFNQSMAELLCGDQFNFTDSQVHEGNCTFSFRNKHLGENTELVPGADYNVTVNCASPDTHNIKSIQVRVIDELEAGENYTSSFPPCSHYSNGSLDRRWFPVELTWTNKRDALGCLTFSVTYVTHDGSKYRKNKKICQTLDCVEYYSSDSGTISSPNYPDDYSDNQECSYYITTKQQQQMFLQFVSFDLEPRYEGSCFDSVSIHGTTTPVSSYCGSYTDPELGSLFFTASGDTMIVKFHSDLKSRSTGFQARFYTLTQEECNKTVSAFNGSISSPNFPSNYFPNQFCTTRIQVPENHTISLEVISLDLEESWNCERDYLSVSNVGESDVPEWRLCGSLSDKTLKSRAFKSTGSSVDVVFKSDHLHEGKGFKAKWTATEDCNSSFQVANNGSLYSPNYPLDYPNNQECSNIIQSDLPTYVLELRFQKLNTESATGKPQLDDLCTLDYVEIYDGKLHHRRCGNWQGREHQLYFLSSGNTLVVKFVSNKRQTAPGFEITWRTISNRTNQTYCPDMWLEVGNLCIQINNSLTSWYEGKLACQRQNSELVTVKDEQIYRFLQNELKLSADGNLSLAFWIGANDIHFENDFYWTDGTRVEKTYWFGGWPNYGLDGKQPSDDGFADEDCVEMRRTFYLPIKGDKSVDDFRWNDRNCATKNGYICQMYKNEADRPVPNGYFPCQRDIVLSTETPLRRLSSPGYPANYSDFLHCVSHIRAPFGYRIEVEFDTFQLEESKNCSFDYLEIESISGRICGNYEGRVKLLHHVSRGNELGIVFSSDHNIVAQGFTFSVRLLEASAICGNGSWVAFGKRCYATFITTKVNQSNAMSICTNMASEISSPLSTEEMEFLSKLVSREEIGYHRVWTPTRTDKLCKTLHLTDVNDHRLTEEDRLCSSKSGFICSKLNSDSMLTESETTTTELHGEWTLLDEKGASYNNNVLRILHISLPANFRIFINISRMDVEYQDTCLYDSLEISEERFPERNKSYCGETSKGIYYHSSGNHVTLRFRSDYSITGYGFDLTWQGYNLSECNRVYYFPERSIHSLGSPVSYFNNMDCNITLEVPEGRRVFLELHQVDFGKSEECSDYLHLDLDGATTHLCAKDNVDNGLMTYLSKGNHLHLRFHTGAFGYGKGFKGFFLPVLDEEGVIESALYLTDKRHGVLESVNRFIGGIDSIDHTIILQAHLGWTISLKIINVTSIKSSESWCTSTFIEISDTTGIDIKSTQRVPLCLADNLANDSSSTLPSTLFQSHLHKVSIRLKTGNTGEELSPGFTILYTVSPDPDFLNKTKAVTDISFPACVEEPFSCQHNGACVSAPDGGFLCRCSGPYTGLLCQVTWCEVDRCVRGRCNLTDTYYTCICEDGFFGEHCDTDSATCRASYCRGHGECFRETVDNFICECDIGHSGPHCETISTYPVMNPRSPSQRLLEEPIWIGLIVILSLVLIFIFMFCVKRKCSKRLERCCGKDKTKEKKEQQNYRTDHGIASPSLPSYNSYVSREPSPLIFRDRPEIFVEEVEDEIAVPVPNNEHQSVEIKRIFNSYHSSIKDRSHHENVSPLARIGRAYSNVETMSGAVGGIAAGSFVLDADQINREHSHDNALSVLKQAHPEPKESTYRLNRTYSSTPMLHRHVTTEVPRARSFEGSDSSHFYPHIVISNEHGGSSTTDEMNSTKSERECEVHPEIDRECRLARQIYSLNIPSAPHSLSGDYFLEYDAKKRRQDFALKSHSASALCNPPSIVNTSALSKANYWNRSSSTESDFNIKSNRRERRLRTGKWEDRAYSDSGLGYQSSCESCHSHSKRLSSCQCRKCIKYDRRHHHSSSRHRRNSRPAEDSVSDFGYSSQSIKKTSSTESDRLRDRFKNASDRSVRKTTRKHRPVDKTDSSNSEKEYRRPARPSLRKAKSQDHDPYIRQPRVNPKDEGKRNKRKKASEELILSVRPDSTFSLPTDGFSESASNDSLLSESTNAKNKTDDTIATISKYYTNQVPVVNITKIVSSDEGCEDVYLPKITSEQEDKSDSALTSAGISSSTHGANERELDKNIRRVSSRGLVRDSAYQTKENSTDKSNSKTTSSVPSPDISETDLSSLPCDRWDDKRITSQLQLAALKLAQLQRRASEKRSNSRRLRVPGNEDSMSSEEDVVGCLPLKIGSHDLSRRWAGKLRSMHNLNRESSLQEVTEENSPVVPEDAYQSAPETFIREVSQRPVFDFIGNPKDNIELHEMV